MVTNKKEYSHKHYHEMGGKERHAELYRLNPLPRLVAQAKRRSVINSIPFNISVDDLKIPEKCPVLGIPIFVSDYSKRGPCPNSPTIDRVNPNLGYVKGNVCIISHRANQLKNNMTLEELFRLVFYVKNYEELIGVRERNGWEKD